MKKSLEPEPDAWEAGAWLPGRQKREYQARSFIRGRRGRHPRERRVLDLNPEITDGAFELRMSKEKLNRPQVAGLLVNLSWFCPSHRVSAIG